MGLEIAVIGNFSVPWSTAEDVASALRSLGHSVLSIHEPESQEWDALIDRIGRHERPDAVIWSRTPVYSREIGHERQLRLLQMASEARIPTIAYHLDRWWGLNREHEVDKEPYFRCQYVLTADGHDQERWKAHDVNHFWSPPAIARRWVGKSLYDHRYLTDVLFVGSEWGYHEQWKHRSEMIRWLRRFYGKRFRQIPDRRTKTIRGERLGTIYASAKVIVGDSCLVPDADGRPYARYCSDRIPETLGRGGFLVHPYVEGVVGHSALDCWRADEHLGVFPLWDFTQMRAVIDYALKHEDERRKVAEAGMEHTRAHHTYEDRMKTVLDLVGIPWKGDRRGGA